VIENYISNTSQDILILHSIVIQKVFIFVSWKLCE